jgi:hypothetical protein
MDCFAQSSTLNHKPQLGPQHRHHHDEVRKNEISYAVGLMRSIAYCRIRLVNRKTAIVAKMTPRVGISCKLRKLFVRRCGLSCDPHGRVTIRPCVIRYLAAKPATMMTKKAMMTNNKWPHRFDGMWHALLPPVTDKHCQYCLYQYTHELDDKQREGCGKMLKNREHERRCLVCNVNLC